MPVVVHSIFAARWVAGADLRAQGLASFERTEQATRALRALVTTPPRDLARPLPMPAPAAPLARRARLRRGTSDAARRRLAYGDGGAVRTPGEAVALADELALYPVTLKAVDTRLVHKSDSGGVRVGLADASRPRRRGRHG